MTATSPYSAESLQLARDTLSDARFLAALHPEHRKQLVQAAMQILRTDRAARLGQRATPETARVIAIPYAIFQAGPLRRQLARKRPHLPTHHTPGDAA